MANPWTVVFKEDYWTKIGLQYCILAHAYNYFNHAWLSSERSWRIIVRDFNASRFQCFQYLESLVRWMVRVPRTEFCVWERSGRVECWFFFFFFLAWWKFWGTFLTYYSYLLFIFSKTKHLSHSGNISTCSFAA